MPTRLVGCFIPIPSMCGMFIYIYIWLKFMVNVGKYTVHGCYGFGIILGFGVV